MEDRKIQARRILKTEKIDALLISSAYNITYLTGFNGFNTNEREGFALLTDSNLYIFTDPRLFEGVKKTLQTSAGTWKKPKIIEYNAEKKLIPQIQEIVDYEKLKIIGFEENLTYSEYEYFKKLKNVKLKLTEEIIEFIRQIKNNYELNTLQAACKLTDKTYSHILKTIRIGQSEKDIAWEVEKFIRESGGELAFPTIVAFSENSATPHHNTSNKKLEKNNIVLLDFGAKVNDYCADMTRTFFMGKASEKFKKIYETVRIGQEIALKCQIIEPTDALTGELIDMTARNYILSQEYPSVPHSIGHGVGIEVHELPHISPGYKEALSPNTSFTIEPGIYISEFGGVRIEDTAWFNGKEIIPLTQSSKKLIEL
ncbi:MAG: aminopeptidase P family protein [Candidatus Levybacteria bacterium]|nr:aminopeptidase P family protein [Candidatus Levybacteria bacterium]MBP9814844.1 aminopeptidase P family protein [Candidatus Levybacteria bacterium]